MYISKLEVDGFRSLSNVKIDDMKPVTLLFGNNGAGKSSILALLEAIFCPKEQRAELPGEPTTQTPFYLGILTNFTNNYRDNKPGIITFSITISMTRSELNSRWPEYIKHGIKVIKDELPEDRVRININGEFHPLDDAPHNAAMVLRKVEINGYIFFNETKRPGMWLPDEPATVSLAIREELGESLLATFTGCFSNIGIARFLHKESVISPHEQSDRSQVQNSLMEFKTRLSNAKQSLNQGEQEKYRRIRDIFSELSKWGEIDFARREGEDNDLEVMSWDENNLWLPISLRGAGAEQLLVIISEVILRKATIIGIEELESNLDETTQGQLIELLRSIIEADEYPTGQIIVTAHSCFYGYHLPPHEKKYVIRKQAGNTDVEPWTSTAFHSLFKSHLAAGALQQTRQTRTRKPK